MKRQRIAQVSVHGCPLRSLGGRDTGGMNVYVRELSAELGRRGIAVDVLTRWHEPAEPEVMSIGERARLVHLEAGGPQDMPRYDIYHYLPQFVHGVQRLQEREGIGYDLIHSHYWLSAHAARELKRRVGIPYVATFHTLGAVKNRARPAEQEPELRIAVEREAIAGADRIIAFTAEERDDLVATYGAEPERVRIVPCGIDLELFRPQDQGRARQALGLPQRSPLLLFAGRIQPIKGIDVLLEAVARLGRHDGLRLLIVGGDSESDEELARLRALCRELAIEERVTFWGAAPHEAMPLFYSAADVCVVPSYHESFGLTAIEALACGTPVVASRAGALATTVRDGESGFLVAERSAEAFAQRLELILGDGGLGRRMGEAGRLSVQRYRWSAVADEVLAVYRELAETYVS